MRFVVAATFLLAAGAHVFACSSFDGDAPTANDAGADQQSSDASPLSEASADAAPSDGSDASGCTLCDDFERAPSLILDRWDDIDSVAEHASIEIAPDAVHGSALHIRASNGPGPEASLEKTLTLGTATKLTVDFDILQSSAFKANLVSLSLLDAQNNGQVFLITVNNSDFVGALQTITNSSDYGSVRTTSLPKVSVWHHVQLSVDFASTSVDVQVDNKPMSSTTHPANLNKYAFERAVLNLGVTYTNGGTFDVWFDNLVAQLSR